MVVAVGGSLPGERSVHAATGLLVLVDLDSFVRRGFLHQCGQVVVAFPGNGVCVVSSALGALPRLLGRSADACGQLVQNDRGASRDRALNCPLTTLNRPAIPIEYDVETRLKDLLSTGPNELAHWAALTPYARDSKGRSGKRRSIHSSSVNRTPRPLTHNARASVDLPEPANP